MAKTLIDILTSTVASVGLAGALMFNSGCVKVNQNEVDRQNYALRNSPYNQIQQRGNQTNVETKREYVKNFKASDGSFYTGEAINRGQTVEPEGHGIISYEGGYLEGEFSQGIFLRGKMKFAGPEGIYEGECMRDMNTKALLPEGKGKSVGKNGDYCEGEFSKGKFVRGKARYNTESGGIYDGECVLDYRLNKIISEGAGKLINNGIVWEGEFSRGDFINGKMIGISPSSKDWQGYVGLLYELNYKNKIMQGSGKVIARGKFVYEGNFKDNLPVDEWKVTFEDGKEFVGRFDERDLKNNLYNFVTEDMKSYNDEMSKFKKLQYKNGLEEGYFEKVDESGNKVKEFYYEGKFVGNYPEDYLKAIYFGSLVKKK